MAYLVRWQLVGRYGRRLDAGRIGESFRQYGEAVMAISEFLKSYPEVHRCQEEGYWLGRRSADADLAVWIWVERSHDAGASFTGPGECPAVEALR
jgi:hypothetical protein